MDFSGAPTRKNHVFALTEAPRGFAGAQSRLQGRAPPMAPHVATVRPAQIAGLMPIDAEFALTTTLD